MANCLIEYNCFMDTPNKIPMDDIKFVLLDMDGTLLDKYFDDFFWEHLVPEKYAEKHTITFGKAKEELDEEIQSFMREH